MIQHQTRAYELNGTLTNLVKFLDLDYEATKRSLNLLAAPWTYNLDMIENDAMKKDTHGNAEEEQHTVTNAAKQEDKKTRRAHQYSHLNVHNALQDSILLDNKDIGESKSSQNQRHYNVVPQNKEVLRLKNKIVEIEEKFDAELITSDMLEQLAYDLNANQVKM